VIIWPIPSETLQLHEERVQQRIADAAPFRFHRPLVRLARAAAAGVRCPQVDAGGRLRGGQAHPAADEVVGLVAD
jgi:hypothetical protein